MTQQDIWTRIDNIDWDSLPHWEFSPTPGRMLNPPKIFRGLVSHDKSMRERALYAFDNVFSHQHGIKENLYHAMPFLLELAEDPSIQYKTEILLFLAAYASYTRPVEGRIYNELYGKIYQQLETSLDYFLRRLLVDTKADKVHIIALLGYLNTKAETVFPKLIIAFQSTTNTDLLIRIFKALSILLQDRPFLPKMLKSVYYDLLWQIIANEAYEWHLKAMSILEHMYINKAETVLEFDQILIDVIVSNETRWKSNPNDSLFHLYYAEELGQQRYIDMLFTLIEKTDHNEFFFWKILGSIFPSRFNPMPQHDAIAKIPLNANQRRFFECVINSVSDLPLDNWLMRYYLPNTKDEMRNLLIADDEFQRQ